MNFKDVKNIKIPEGVVVKITSKGVVLWEKKGVEPDTPDLPTPNSNEIYYTSTDGKIVEPYNLPSDYTLISNTYENGIGKMVFENDIKSTSYGLFMDCTTLKTIIFPQGLRNLGESILSGCTALESVIIPNSVTNIGQTTFRNCISLKSIQLPDSIRTIELSAFKNSGLEHITIPDSVGYLGESVFEDCKDLKYINIPTNINGIPNLLFRNCISLENILIPNNIKTIGYSAFWGCESLKNIEIPETITSIDYLAFPRNISIILNSTQFTIENDCLIDIENKILIEGLVDKTNYIYDIPNSINVIGEGAFEYIKNIDRFIVPNTVTEIERYCFTASSLVNIEIPDSVTSIGQFAFGNCRNLISITIPNSITYIPDHCFQNCTSLKTIDLPNTITAFGYYAFDNSGLEHITIPDSVTEIYNYNFQYCFDLKSIDLSKNLQLIGYEVFYQCYNVEIITCKAMQAPTIESNTFSSVGSKVPEGQPKILYVPQGATGYEKMLNQLNSYGGGWELQYITE